MQLQTASMTTIYITDYYSVAYSQDSAWLREWRI